MAKRWSKLELKEGRETILIETIGYAKGSFKDDVRKYANGLLNSHGGVIYFGVSSSGTVRGKQISRKEEDDLRLAVDHAFGSFQPFVSAQHYRLTFTPCDSSGYFIIELKVSIGEIGEIYEDGMLKVYIIDSAKLIGPLHPQELRELILLKYKQSIEGAEEAAKYCTPNLARAKTVAKTAKAPMSTIPELPSAEKSPPAKKKPLVSIVKETTKTTKIRSPLPAKLVVQSIQPAKPITQSSATTAKASVKNIPTPATTIRLPAKSSTQSSTTLSGQPVKSSAAPSSMVASKPPVKTSTQASTVMTTRQRSKTTTTTQRTKVHATVNRTHSISRIPLNRNNNNGYSQNSNYNSQSDSNLHNSNYYNQYPIVNRQPHYSSQQRQQQQRPIGGPYYHNFQQPCTPARQYMFSPRPLAPVNRQCISYNGYF